MTSTLTGATLPGAGLGRPGIRYPPGVAPTKKPSSKNQSAAKAAPTRRPTKGSRYTPPAPKKAKSSHLWVPATMFTCLVLGVVVIAGNYMELLPGGDVSNNFLLIGLVLLVSGFVLSTFFR
jgi:Cell division protein CrgA